jgi:prepilin-type N-terminal cleavage/methylation domain-containing protein
MMRREKTGSGRPAFTLVELLVVLGVIVVLIGMLLPALTRSRQQANSVVCQSNLRQIGIAMLMYADQYDGFLFPSDMGYDAQHVIPYPDTGAPGTIHNVWPLVVFGVWNPPVMICPSDQQPLEQHSYVVNSHMAYWNVKYNTVLPNQLPSSLVVLMGEKVTLVGDYYMEYGDFGRVVDEFRHGQEFGSNYLMLDLHVTTQLPAQAESALDPWDFAAGVTPPTVSGSGS